MAVLNSVCTLGVGVIGPLLFCMSVYTKECTGGVMKTEYHKAMGNYSELGRYMSVSYSDRGYQTPVGVVGFQYQSCLNSIIPWVGVLQGICWSCMLHIGVNQL